MSRVNGKVKWFNEQKGYGFLVPEDGGRDVFVHADKVEASGIGKLQEGQAVSFEVKEFKGKNQAENLELL